MSQTKIADCSKCGAQGTVNTLGCELCGPFKKETPPPVFDRTLEPEKSRSSSFYAYIPEISEPPYYTSGEIECWDYICSLGEDIATGFLRGNVIKYLHRFGSKEEGTRLKDARKAQAYVNRLVKYLEENK